MSTAASDLASLAVGAGPAPRRRSRKRAAGLLVLLLPGVLLLAVGLLWPFASMFGISLYDKYPQHATLTLANYQQFIGDPYHLTIVLRTFALAVVVTLLTAVIGYPVAWYLAWSESRFKHLIFLAVVFPLLVSIVVRTIGWTILLGNEGLVNSVLMWSGIVKAPLRLMQSFWSVVVGMTHILLPFMVLSIYSVLGKIDRSLIESAGVLGASPARTFLRVVLPMSIQGVAAGSVIVFCLCIGAYITPTWLGRGHVTVMSMSIYEQMVVTVEWPLGAAASMLLTVVTLAVLLLYAVFVKRLARR